jgi:glutaminase
MLFSVGADAVSVGVDAGVSVGADAAASVVGAEAGVSVFSWSQAVEGNSTMAVAITKVITRVCDLLVIPAS